MPVKHLHADGDLAVELTNAGGKLVVVDFFATWCGPCRAVAPQLEHWSEIYTNVVFVKVDVDQMTATAQQYGIRAMPTFLFFKNGQQVASVRGANVPQIEANIREHSLYANDSQTQGSSSAYADPFTGSGRYVPSGAGVSASLSGGFRDPFTGASAYVSGGANTQVQNGARVAESGEPARDCVYPVREYLAFHAGNVDGIIKKLEENIDNAGFALTGPDIHVLKKLMQKDLCAQPVSPSTLTFLRKTLDLLEDKVFPALDLLRLAIRHSTVCNYFWDPEQVDFFIQFLLPLMKSTVSSANQQLTFKIISNTFVGGSIGVTMLTAHRKAILAALSEGIRKDCDKNVQVAMATALLNYAILGRAQVNFEDQIALLSVVVDVSVVITDDEAAFRLLSAVGTVLAGGGEEIRGYAQAVDFAAFGLTMVNRSTDQRVLSVWKCLEKDLSAPSKWLQ